MSIFNIINNNININNINIISQIADTLFFFIKLICLTEISKQQRNNFLSWSSSNLEKAIFRSKNYSFTNV